MNRDPLLRYGIDPLFPHIGETELDHELNTLLNMTDADLLHVLRYTNMRRTVEVIPGIINLRCANRIAGRITNERGLL